MTERGVTRVLHLASGDLWAGAEVQIYNMARAARAAGDMEFSFVLLNDSILAARLRELGASVTVIDERRYGAFSTLLNLVRLIRQARPDVVHTHRKKENVLGAIAACAARVPSVRTVHGAAEHAYGAWNMRQWLISTADTVVGRHLQRAVVCVSDTLAAAERTKLGTHVHMIPNGVDIENVCALAGEGAQRSPSEPALRAAIVGRLVPVKRVDIFLQIAKLAEQRWPGRWRFLIAGDGPLRSTLEAQCAELGLHGVVEFLGFVENTPSLMRRVDALLITSDSEGLPMVLLEAMALGVVTMARDVGEIGAVLAHGEAGVLLADSRPEAFVAALAELVQDRNAFAQRTALARTRVRHAYSAVACVASHARLYASVATAAGARNSSTPA
jgi:glycosyltransferase involved in cell wall biosynthesis